MGISLYSQPGAASAPCRGTDHATDNVLKRPAFVISLIRPNSSPAEDYRIQTEYFVWYEGKKAGFVGSCFLCSDAAGGDQLDNYSPLHASTGGMAGGTSEENNTLGYGEALPTVRLSQDIGKGKGKRKPPEAGGDKRRSVCQLLSDRAYTLGAAWETEHPNPDAI